MNKQLLKVIQAAIQSDKSLFPLNQSWALLHEQYNIGCTQGNKLHLNLQDKAELLMLTQQVTGIDLAETLMTDFVNMQREQALAVAIDEKFAGLAVKKDRLAMKTLSGQTLKINDKAYPMPDCGHLDIALSDLSNTAHRCVLIIENYRCFDALQKIHLSLSKQYADPLVLFRGDNTYSENTVRRLLALLNLPVLVMADLDPKGLLIMQSFPKVCGLIAPCHADLDILFNDTQKANTHLYTKQLAGCQQALETTPYAGIRAFWSLMKTHQAGIVQEYWLHDDYTLVLHKLD
ncbi:MAG: hypothetical protein HOP02_05070 [Methylococcaceae bacterium]|nr:hypothetical protein [Methylococcaceae bacterium]